MKLPEVIIPTYTNTSGLVKLLAQLKGYEGQIVVVDNKPPTSPRLRGAGSENITYLPQTRNLGFARGVNVGAKEVVGGDWLAILNDDIVLPSKDTLSELAEYAEKMGLDAVSPILKKPDGKIENYGYTVLPIGKVKLNFDDNRLESSYLDGITAACLIIKRDVFNKMNGFDESFFAYLEDVDLFLRMKKARYTFGICADISVIHNHMGTSSKMGWFKEKQDLKNWFRVIVKNWGWKKIVINFPGIFIERLRNLSGLIKKIVKIS